jgi:beta-glucanase (GH16 family)
MKRAAVILLCLYHCVVTGKRSWTQSVNPDSNKQENLVWSDEFNSATLQGQPNPANWNYDTGAGRWGNKEQETYCAWASTTAPCDTAQPNVFVGDDGYLHIVARSPRKDVFSSARLKTQGLHGFRYGRVEARIKIPEGQGIWPAFWMLGDRVTSVGWPACGEIDIMENIGKEPSVAHGSLHGPGGGDLTKSYTLPNNEKLASDFHIYGIIWSPGRVQFYVDDPSNNYATFTPADLPKNAVWPFNTGKFFLILNVAVGGSWPGYPDATTKFPQEMLVDYVRVYAEPDTERPRKAGNSAVR